MCLLFVGQPGLNLCIRMVLGSSEFVHTLLGSTQPTGAQTHDCLIVDTPIRFTVFYDCINTKIKSFTQLSKPYTQGAKHGPRSAPL